MRVVGNRLSFFAFDNNYKKYGWFSVSFNYLIVVKNPA